VLPLIIILFLLVFAAAAGLVVVVLVAWEERRRVPKVVPFCSRCGYELTGLSSIERCPECACTEPRAYRSLFESPRRAAALRPCVLVPIFAALPPALVALVLPGATIDKRLIAFAGVILTYIALAVLLRTVGSWITPTAARSAAMLGTLPVAISTLTLATLAFFHIPSDDPNQLAVLVACTLPLAAPGLWLAVRSSMIAGWDPGKPEPQPMPAARSSDDVPRRWTLDRSGRVRHD
jgi:hypothetical protein